MTRLLGIAGRAGSGKSTAAQVLIDAGWHRVKLAGPLKNMLRAIGLSDRHIEGDLKSVSCDLLGGRTPRYAMQTLGTEWGRDLISSTLWLDIAQRDISAALSEGRSVVIDDVRFQSEAELVRALGGTVLRIERTGVDKGSHISEADVTADIDYDNCGTEQELRAFMLYVFAMAKSCAS